MKPFDVYKIREDFPVLGRTVHGKPLVYFDTAASAQRPLAVIEAIDRFYRHHNANVHRGVHTLSQEATDLYEEGRRSTPYVGVSSSPRKTKVRYRAFAQTGHGQKCIGYFDDMREAAIARDEWVKANDAPDVFLNFPDKERNGNQRGNQEKD